jgi:hypothetical protein
MEDTPITLDKNLYGLQNVIVGGKAVDGLT